MNFNADNERIKHAYFQYLQTAGRKSPKTVEQARKAIIEYEKFTNFASFKSFNKHKAIDYKNHLAFKKAKHSKELIKPTTLRNLIKPLIAFLR